MTPPLRILAQPAFGRRELNPYTWRLSTALHAAGAEVCEFSWSEASSGRHDIWHLHWPETEAQFTRGHVRLVVRRSARLLMLLRLARSRGTRVVWTVHNLRSHEQRFPRLEAWFWRLFVREVDGVISLSRHGLNAAVERFPRLASRPRFVVPHGHYRDSYPNTTARAEARAALGIDPDARVMTFVGQIREYKNVPELIAAARGLADPSATLVVAGRTTSPALSERVQAAAGADPRIRLDLRLIPENEVQLFLNAADLVVLPYREVLNSGAALLALSFNRPALVPAAGALPELQESVGPAWVRTYQGAITAGVLDDALHWSRATVRPPEAPLAAYDWDLVAQTTLAAYRAVIAERGAQREQRAPAPTRGANAGVRRRSVTSAMSRPE